jgi:hypothetical protein
MVRKSIPENMRMVANIGDFGLEEAAALSAAAQTGLWMFEHTIIWREWPPGCYYKLCSPYEKLSQPA